MQGCQTLLLLYNHRAGHQGHGIEFTWTLLAFSTVLSSGCILEVAGGAIDEVHYSVKFWLAF